MLRTFEIDDYPFGENQILRCIATLKQRFPAFKVTLFAVPIHMTGSRWRRIKKLGDWVQVAPHGFTHAKRECRKPRLYRKYLGLLDRIAKDRRWTKLFKPPWYGYDKAFMRELQDRGFACCTKGLIGVPYPCPETWRHWNLTDRVYATLCSGEDSTGLHVVAHPCYPDKRVSKSTEISRRHIARWTEPWTQQDRWAFSSDLVTPMLRKLNLGCGHQVWPGWTCLDPRKLHPDIIEWDFSQQIPIGDNKADVVLTSHVMEYVDEEFYAEALLEIWRVLRPGGVLRMSEAETDSGYVWRRPGQPSRGTGVIRSLPTKKKIVAALNRVGFQVHQAGPGETLSPHKDVLLGDTRRRRYAKGQKFYVEAVKHIDFEGVLDLRRPARWDVRSPCPRRQQTFGRYKLPPP